MEIILVKYQTALNVFFFFSMAMDGKILQFRKNCLGFPGSSAGKESICNARDLGSIPGLGRSAGGDGNPL